MNFQQLRIIRETIRRQYNLTEAAAALHTSQSGVSKHIKDLEDELGVEIFVRKGKRLLGLTDPGREVAEIVERMLVDADNVRRIGNRFGDRDEGRLTIATTHTQARYALTEVVRKFRLTFPQVHLALHQGSPTELAQMLLRATLHLVVHSRQPQPGQDARLAKASAVDFAACQINSGLHALPDLRSLLVYI